MVSLRSIVFGALLVAPAMAEVYFKEDFSTNDWEKRWVKSTAKPSGERGEWKWTAGQWYADKDDKGIQTSQDARFYGLSAKMDKVFDNKDKDLIVQFTVKHEQVIDCGGAYIKVLPSGLDQTKFGGDSAYRVMFGPDVCGMSRRTHAILNYAGPDGKKEPQNLLHNGDIRTETDQLTHLYTFIVKKDNTYDVLIDDESVQSGKLEEKWDFLPPKKIKDPAAKKPADWVDEKQIPDPEDKKPDGYDDIPAQIPDPEAKQPEDWDEDDDGEWEPPMIANPDFKGEWRPKMIKNPAYKGEWVHPEIDNPDYFEDENLYHRCPDCEYVGFELWQVKSGTIFDKIIVTDSIEEAKEAGKAWKELKDAEKTMFDEAQKKKAEEAAKRAEEEKKAAEAKKAEEDDDDDDDEDDVLSKGKEEL